MRCKICGSESKLFDKAILLDNYDVNYYQCSHCGFIQTEEPFWLEQAYSSAITSYDIGLLQRNMELSLKIDYLFRSLYDKNDGHFLDYGGGYGIFVRLMRDKGFDFEWFDKYCNNIFSCGHEKKRDKYDFVCSFEMLEHLADPISTLDEIFTLGDNAIFSTVLLPTPYPRINDWWYYSPKHGQHISFYTKKSMLEISKKYGKYYSNILGLHLFTTERISSSVKVNLCITIDKYKNSFIDRVILPKRKSLQNDDYCRIVNNRRNSL